MAPLFSPAMQGAGRPKESGPQVGHRIGQYELQSVLGEGAMGVVFRACRDPEGESVAVKVLRDELAEDALYRGRFRREARIASEVTHERIVPVVDFGEASGRLYIVSLYVQGVPLSVRIASEGKLTLAEAMRVLDDVSSALEALAERDLVHRDVKPANVIIDEFGSASLTDFGLARGVADTVLTKTGAVAGTVDYLAPELIRGQQASAASDVYALGCLLYECLSGAPPFAGRSYVDTLIAHIQEEAPNLDYVPENVSAAVLEALAKEPAERPAATAYARLVRRSAQTA